MMLYSLPVPHFPFIGCTADKHAVEHSVEALSSAAFNMLVSQAVEQLKFDSVGRNFPSYYSRAVASSKAEPEALLTKRPCLSHS